MPELATSEDMIVKTFGTGIVYECICQCDLEAHPWHVSKGVFQRGLTGCTSAAPLRGWDP